MISSETSHFTFNEKLLFVLHKGYILMHFVKVVFDTKYNCASDRLML